MTNPVLPVDVLVTHAEQQRKRIHNDIAGLRSNLRSTLREATDSKRIARENLPAACGAAGVVALLLGYGLAGMFVRD